MRSIEILLFSILGVVVLMLVGFEAYVWRTHGYDPEYQKIQRCIESAQDPSDITLCKKVLKKNHEM